MQYSTWVVTVAVRECVIITSYITHLPLINGTGISLTCNTVKKVQIQETRREDEIDDIILIVNRDIACLCDALKNGAGFD